MIYAGRQTGDISCQKIEFQRVCGHRGRGCAVAFVIRYALSSPAELGDIIAIFSYFSQDWIV